MHGIDTKMASPSPPPAFGSSKMTGGILHGKQVKYDLADAHNTQNQALPITARVHLYAGCLKPNEVSIQDNPTAKIRCSAYTSTTTLLPALARKYEELSGKCLMLSIFLL